MAVSLSADKLFDYFRALYQVPVPLPLPSRLLRPDKVFRDLAVARLPVGPRGPRYRLNTRLAGSLIG